MKYFTASLLMLAGGATAFQGWQLLMWAIWGRPTHWIQYVAILGSMLQVVAGLVLFWRDKSLAIAGLALLLTWLFYAPALFNTIRAEWNHIRFKPAGAIPSLLLIAATMAVISLFRSRKRVHEAAA
jgi:hypothetical protein